MQCKCIIYIAPKNFKMRTALNHGSLCLYFGFVCLNWMLRFLQDSKTEVLIKKFKHCKIYYKANRCSLLHYPAGLFSVILCYSIFSGIYSAFLLLCYGKTILNLQEQLSDNDGVCVMAAKGCGCFFVTEQMLSCDAKSAIKAGITSN